MHRAAAISRPQDSAICTPDQMDCIVKGSFESAVQMASESAACFRFLKSGFKRMRLLHEWNAEDSPDVIMSRVDRIHVRMLHEASTRLRKIPEKRAKAGATGYEIIQDVDDIVAEEVLRTHRVVAVDVCRGGPGGDGPLDAKDHCWYKWFRFCVLNTPFNLVSDPEVLQHILRRVTIWDTEVIHCAIAHNSRVFFESFPEKWDAACRTNPDFLRHVGGETDILIRALEQSHGDPSTFKYMHHLLEDKKFMAEAVYINPILLHASPLEDDVCFVLELVSRVHDDICASVFNNNMSNVDKRKACVYLPFAVHAVRLDLETTWRYSHDVVEAALQHRPRLVLLSQPALLKAPEYLDVLVRTVAQHWGAVWGIIHNNTETGGHFIGEYSTAQDEFITLLLQEMARVHRPALDMYAVYKCCRDDQFKRIFDATEPVFVSMITGLMKSRCKERCRFALKSFRLGREAVKKITRVLPPIIEFVQDPVLLNDDAFILSLLETDPSVYYHLSRTPYELPPYTRLRWGVARWVDMKQAFSRWGASDSLYDVFLYITFPEILWYIWSPTLHKLPLPTDLLRHTMSFLSLGFEPQFTRHARVLVRLKGGAWVPGVVRKNKHPDYRIKLDSGHKKTIRRCNIKHA